MKDAPAPGLPGALVFETRTNVWRRHPEWPVGAAEPRTLYFRDRGRLSFESPTEAEASDTYVSDPAKPVPWLGYTALTVPEEYTVADQRFAATRPDVLMYATEPLEEDLAIAGPVMPRLFVSTTGTDADWAVKLIDVYRGDRSTPEAPAGGAWSPPVALAGYQQLVGGWPLRGKFRRSFETPEPFETGQVEAIEFAMPDVNHVFPRGHRVMVQVQSTFQGGRAPAIPQPRENAPTALDGHALVAHRHEGSSQLGGAKRGRRRVRHRHRRRRCGRMRGCSPTRGGRRALRSPPRSRTGSR